MHPQGDCVCGISVADSTPAQHPPQIPSPLRAPQARLHDTIGQIQPTGHTFDTLVYTILAVCPSWDATKHALPTFSHTQVYC